MRLWKKYGLVEQQEGITISRQEREQRVSIQATKPLLSFIVSVLKRILDETGEHGAVVVGEVLRKATDEMIDPPVIPLNQRPETEWVNQTPHVIPFNQRHENEWVNQTAERIASGTGDRWGTYVNPRAMTTQQRGEDVQRYLD